MRPIFRERGCGCAVCVFICGRCMSVVSSVIGSATQRSTHRAHIHIATRVIRDERAIHSVCAIVQRRAIGSSRVVSPSVRQSACAACVGVRRVRGIKLSRCRRRVGFEAHTHTDMHAYTDHPHRHNHMGTESVYIYIY